MAGRVNAAKKVKGAGQVKTTATLAIDTTLLRPGMRLGVGVSGGADSVALLRALYERKAELGLVLHVAHLHHGLRGAEADADLEFVRALAAGLGLPFHEGRVETAREAQENGESIEEAARRLRYGWFRRLTVETPLDALATAHTRDDQAETVLGKFLRGAWTEGLAGIAPKLEWPEGKVVRPLLGATRGEVESYLKALGQGWREDTSNRDEAYTRNRIRHELLPLLEGWNPRLREHMAQMADVAREEEAWWEIELGRVAPQLLLPGKPVRGGGRSSWSPTLSASASERMGHPASLSPTLSAKRAERMGHPESLAIDVTRFAGLAPAMQRRLLRHAAEKLGCALDFGGTEALRMLAVAGRAGQRRELAEGLRGERTPRELRLTVEAAWSPTLSAKDAERMGHPAAGGSGAGDEAVIPEYLGAVPGEIAGPGFGLRLRVERAAGSAQGGALGPKQGMLRNWRPGDRVTLRYSSGPRKVKEVLERLRVTGSDRAVWPVLEVEGRIVWMRGVELQPEAGLVVTAVGSDENGAS
jgi:tRNA(Ile)-lysidine synthase